MKSLLRGLLDLAAICLSVVVIIVVMTLATLPILPLLLMEHHTGWLLLYVPIALAAAWFLGNSN